MWRKAAFAVLWIAGVTFVALRFGGGYEERIVDTARLEVSVLPASHGQKVPERAQIELEGDITEGGGRVRWAVDAGDGRHANPSGPEIEVILDRGEDVYISFLVDAPKLPGGASWMRVDVADAGRVIPGLDGAFGLFQAGTFLTSRPPLDLPEAGRETVNGVETTRYRTETSAEQVEEILEGSPALQEIMEGGFADEAEVTFWQDDEGFLRRFTMNVPAGFLLPRRGDDEQLLLQYDVLDLGGDVTVELPDEDDTASF